MRYRKLRELIRCIEAQSPSVNVTVPLRAPDPGATAETFAAKVTAWSGPDELGADVTTVLVRLLSTV